MRTSILLSTLVVPILFLPGIEKVVKFKYVFLKGDCCGSMPLMDANDPGGPIARPGGPIARFLGSPGVQSCLEKGRNIGLVGTKKGSAPYCWEPEPPVNLDPSASAKRAAPVDTLAVRSAIACWNRNGSVTRKGQGLSCIDTPEVLRREVQQVAIKEEGVKG